jgi:hypothetical protein
MTERELLFSGTNKSGGFLRLYSGLLIECTGCSASNMGHPKSAERRKAPNEPTRHNLGVVITEDQLGRKGRCNRCGLSFLEEQ